MARKFSGWTKMKYQVIIPKPSRFQSKVRSPKSARLTERNLVVEFNNAQQLYPLLPNVCGMEFDVPDNLDYVYSKIKIDRIHSFNVWVEASNKDGDHKQRINLVPMKVEND